MGVGAGAEAEAEAGAGAEVWRMPSLLAKRIVAIILLLVAAGIVTAQTGTYNPDAPADAATEARLKELSLELRCLVCQNQTIADSNADLAVDLRGIVRAQILQGKTDAEIKTYLVSRYGDFVLYKPPMQGNTAMLWIGPFGLLAIGVIIWWMIGRKKKGVAETTISEADAAKAKQLLE